MKRGGARWKVRGAIGLVLLTVTRILAATTPDAGEEKLSLNPPYPEIAPSFWERFGIWLPLLLVPVILIAIALWLVLRRRTSVVEPIESRARRELAELSRRPENARVLVESTRILRRYLAAAFELSPEEMTTREFSRALQSSEKVGASLAAEVVDYLKRCDELKFSPPSSSPQPPLNAASRALALVQLGENRRAELRQLAKVPSGKPQPIPA